jgi:hypothetical protein
MKKQGYETKFYYLSDIRPLYEDLNEFGEQGWEAISTISGDSNGRRCY